MGYNDGYLRNNQRIEEFLKRNNIIGECINANSPNSKIYISKQNKNQAVKVFDYKSNCDKNIILKRKCNFDIEIENLKYLNNKIGREFKNGICELIDCGKTEYDNDHYSYYIMPKYDQYNSKNEAIKVLNDFIYLFKVLSQIHKLGYLHLDIKPQNIMSYNNVPVLIDFGCSKRINSECGNFKRVASLFTPPELEEQIEGEYNLDDIDWRKSDIYMLSKTLWAILQDDIHNRVFFGDFDRKLMESIKNRIDANCEPLIILFSKTIITDIESRITIEECIKLIDIQIQIFRREYSEKNLNVANFSLLEEIHSNSPDVIEINNVDKIKRIMKKIKVMRLLCSNRRYKNEHCKVMEFENDITNPLCERHFVIRIKNEEKGLKNLNLHVIIDKIQIIKCDNNKYYLRLIISSKEDKDCLELKDRYSLPYTYIDNDILFFENDGDYYLDYNWTLEYEFNSKSEILSLDSLF